MALVVPMLLHENDAPNSPIFGPSMLDDKKRLSPSKTCMITTIDPALGLRLYFPTRSWSLGGGGVGVPFGNVNVSSRAHLILGVTSRLWIDSDLRIPLGFRVLSGNVFPENVGAFQTAPLASCPHSLHVGNIW